MTNGEKIKEIFPNAEIDKGKDGNDIIWIAIDCWTTFTKDWWNAEYKEPTIEHEQKINKSAMMQEIYMEGVNMGGEYQGCWVRFKEIEKIIDKYVR